MRRLLAVVLAGVGAAAARSALPAVTAAAPAQALARTNFRGRTVSLAGGPALAVGASGAAALGAGSRSAAAAALVAGLGSGAVGAYDDIVGARPEQKAAKGFRGHLSALREGRVTSGLIKIVGVGASGLAAAALLAADRRQPPAAGRRGRRRGRPAAGRPGRGRGSARLARGAEVLLGAGVIAGTANLVNLLDLRPGRAIKAGLLVGVPLAASGGTSGRIAAGTVGAAAGLLPADLGEEIMIGDAGANALGALLGTSLAARTGPVGRGVLLAGIVALTAASERVSFTQVIARTPVLRELDELGRLDARTGTGTQATASDVAAAVRPGPRPGPGAD